jgi:hypothetical protein
VTDKGSSLFHVATAKLSVEEMARIFSFNAAVQASRTWIVSVSEDDKYDAEVTIHNGSQIVWKASNALITKHMVQVLHP